MSQPVDHDLLLQYVHRELDGEPRDRVRALVASDPAWRAAMRDLLALELELADALGDVQPAPAAPSRRGLWALTALVATAAAGLLVARPEATIVVTQRVDPTGSCPTPRAGVTLGEAAPAAELCAGDALEWELRPSRASTWEAPEVRLDGRAASCPSEPVGDQGVGRVRCTLGVDLPISDTLPHTLEIVHDGAVIATTVIRLGAP